VTLTTRPTLPQKVGILELQHHLRCEERPYLKLSSHATLEKSSVTGQGRLILTTMDVNKAGSLKAKAKSLKAKAKSLKAKAKARSLKAKTE